MKWFLRDKYGRISPLLNHHPHSKLLNHQVDSSLEENPFTTMVYHKVCWGSNYLITRGAPCHAPRLIGEAIGIKPGEVARCEAVP